MNIKLSVIILVVVLISCSSRTLKKSYIVEDASHQEIPGWVSEASTWTEKNIKDHKKYKFYSFTTDPKNSRTVACEVAKIRSSSEIASEVTQFIKHSFSTTTEGNAKDLNETLDEYIDETLTKEVRSHIVGAQIIRKYWEKRSFKVDLGAKRDVSGYTCSTLIQISKSNMKTAFDMAFKKLKAKSKKYDLKAKIIKAKDDVKKDLMI